MNELSSIRKPGEGLSLDEVCYTPPYRNIDMLFCAEVPIVSQEWFKAGIQDIRAEKSLIVDLESFTCAGEPDRLKYKDVVYSIYHVYPTGDGRLQLYLTQKAGVR